MTNLDRHRAWKRAIHPVALRYVQAGHYKPQFPESPVISDDAHAWGLAHVAAWDFVVRGKTRMLPMDECLAVDPFAVALAEAAE